LTKTKKRPQPKKQPIKQTPKGPAKNVRKGVRKIGRPRRPDGTIKPTPFDYADKPGKKPAAPVSVSEAKASVANLIAKSQAAGARPRDMAELFRVYSSLAELEAKLSAEDVESIKIIDVDPDGVQVINGVRMRLVPE